MTRLIDRDTLDFLLHDVLDISALCARPRFADMGREVFDATIDAAYKLAERYFAPHNAKADEHEPSFDGERVTIISEVKEALTHYAQAGLIAARYDHELGGMQLPTVAHSAAQAVFTAANPSTVAYPFLTGAAANLIQAFAAPELKARFLPPMLDGRFFGTMALTEPGVGSSLGDLRTAAEPAADGSYRIKGQKMFISGGDHEMSENIVHLVLARIKGAPLGVKGISLFLVPKFLVDADGRCTTRNDVALAGLLHKMGYRGTTSTVLNFGERDACVGYLIGQPHQGLSYMFKMMNEARIGVGLGATAIGYRGYLESLAYARERPQGRLPSNRDVASPPVLLVEHADIRRMLLAQKAYVEGGLHLCLYAARLVDELDTARNDAERATVGDLLDLLTPIVKAWPSHYGPKANDLAIQILGGAGYTREYPVEQCYRDNRLNPIHEGTNGIQALDLLGRKLWQNRSQGLQTLLQQMHAAIGAAQAHAELAPLVAEFGKALSVAQSVTTQLGQAIAAHGPDRALANASLYLDLFGKLVVAWLWLQQATVAATRLANTDARSAFLRGKQQAARYFILWELPKIHHQADLLSRIDPCCLDMRDEWF